MVLFIYIRGDAAYFHVLVSRTFISHFIHYEEKSRKNLRDTLNQLCKRRVDLFEYQLKLFGFRRHGQARLDSWMAVHYIVVF